MIVYMADYHQILSSALIDPCYQKMV